MLKLPIAPAVCAALTILALAGCKDDKPKSKPSSSAPATPESGVSARHEAPPPPKVPYASEADVERFVTACEKLQTGAPSGGDEATPGGAVHRGKVPATGGERPPADGVFRWTERTPEYLDPNLIADSPGHAIGLNLFEPLLVPAPGNSPPRPGAAERWEVSDDGLTWTFHLREGLVWSNGEPLTAEDFRYGWLRGLAPETASKNAQQIWSFVAGAEAFNAGRERDPATVGVEAVDARTLKVRLKTPTPFFPHVVTYIAYAPVPRHAIEAHGKAWTRPEHIVVNGPYTLEAFEPRDRLVLKANPRYWDAKNVAVKRSVVQLSESEDTNVTWFQSGQVHAARPLPPDVVRRLIASGSQDLRIDEHMCTYYLALDIHRPPFDEPKVREALFLAVDRERLARHVLGRMETPATHLVPDMFRRTIGYRAVSGPKEDVARARELLSEAGYPNGAGLPPLELRYNTSEVHRQVAEFLQRELSQNLGITVKLHNMEWKSLLKALRTGDYQMSRAAWCADYPDPTSFLELLRSGVPINYTRYANPAYDALVDRVRAERDPKRRNVLMCAAEKVIARDKPIVPLFFYTHAYLLDPRVKGYEPQFQDVHLLKYLRIPGAEGTP